MDAVEFVKQLRRMDKNTSRKYSVFDDSPEDVIEEVEEWAKKNPAKTRQSVFLEQYPNANIIEGTLTICPYNLGLIDKCRSGLGNLCYECREKFWGQEVE